MESSSESSENSQNIDKSNEINMSIPKKELNIVYLQKKICSKIFYKKKKKILN